MKDIFFKINIILFIILIGPFNQISCQPWNNPHLETHSLNTAYFPFVSSPKTLDPARSYTAEDNQYIAQIYEPPLQYHLLKRPYTLIPLTSANLPVVHLYNAQGQMLPLNTNPQEVAYSTYDITLKPGIFYQPHPAFAKDKSGQYLYLNLSENELKKVHKLDDMKYLGTRELIADDYIYELKRLADPRVQSPIFTLMSKHILGLSELAKQLQQSAAKNYDLRNYSLAGAKVIDRYHYQITIKGFYPQFIYWLAMPFLAPVPWEAMQLYAQKGLSEKNISLDWWPVGTGAYMLIENNPNRKIVLERNPNFHPEFFPTEGEVGDLEKGYLQNAGKKLPFIDQVVFTMDRESIPRWNKFIQGYYDVSGISADSFDQAVQLNSEGQANLTPALQKKKMRLSVTVEPWLFYTAFNMMDPIVGGYSPQKQKLRRALAIAIDQEEFIRIFLNGRGVPAQGPLPPGIFGYQSGQQGINPYVYYWEGHEAKRRPLSEAKKLLAEAGYPNGIDPKTKKPLILNYDLTSIGTGADDAAEFNWYRKQFAKLGIELNIRATLYNRFQDKVRSGGVQIFAWGWNADYPDPENFLFLLYGHNSIVKSGGENTANYENSQADKIFPAIADLPNSPQRQESINQFLEIIRQDGPWIWGYYPRNFVLSQIWLSPIKPSAILANTLKYRSLDGSLRAKLREEWNPPIMWPIWLILGLFIACLLPLFGVYWMRELKPNIKKF